MMVVRKSADDGLSDYNLGFLETSSVSECKKKDQFGFGKCVLHYKDSITLISIWRPKF